MKVERRLRIVLVEDEPLFRDLLASTLSQQAELELIGTFSNGRDAMLSMKDLNPDVVVLDIDLGAGDTGFEVGLRARQVIPEVGVVLLSNYDEPGILAAIPAKEAYGWSYLLKKSVASLDSLLRAIEGSACGLMVIDPHLLRAFRPGHNEPLDRLTPRQREVLSLIAMGFSNHSIAQKLTITEKSVENQISLIYQNLGLQSADPGIHPRVTAAFRYANAVRH